jgi:predicted CXXCH cytochrome family protein
MRRSYAARTLLVCALFLGFALGVAPAAYASTESTYAAWVDTGYDHSQPHDTPHRDYATTTTKCAVCHAVHKAPADGELLLRSTVGEACVYCHVDSSLGVIVIYGGNVANYSGTDTDHGHQAPAVECSDCHSVHGANTFGGPAETKILKVWNIQQSLTEYLMSGSLDTTAIINGEPPLDAITNDPEHENGWPGQWETEFVQDTAFCSQCHPYYTAAAETTITAQVVQSNGAFLEKTFKSHPLKRPGGENGYPYYEGFDASGTALPHSQSVASMGPRGCVADCHTSPGGPHGDDRGHDQVPDAGRDIDNSYPHYNVYTSRFLSGGIGAPGGNNEPVADSTSDAACLKCHVWEADPSPGGRDAGAVGVTY